MNKPCSLDMTSFKGRKRLDIASRGDNPIQDVQKARGPSACVLHGTHTIFHKCAQCGLEIIQQIFEDLLQRQGRA